MAIGLETDFRTLKTAQAAEPAERRPANRGHGEDFASSLRKARDAGAGEVEPGPRDAAQVAQPPGLPAPEPILEAAQPALETIAIAGPPAASVPQDAVAEAASAQSLLIEHEQTGVQAGSDELKSEIVLDRELVRQRVETNASLPPAAFASLDVALPVAAPKRPDLAMPTEAAAARLQAPAAPAGAVPEGIIPDQSPAPKTDVAALAVVAVSTASKPVAEPEPKQAATGEGSEAPVAKADPQAFARAEHPPETSPAPAQSAPNAITAPAGSGAETSSGTSNPATQAPGATLIAAAGPAAPQMAAPVAPSLPMTPALAVLTASPAQIVDIVAQSAADGQSDHIVVQLDPPELGRVSIDFKFDAQGLQHVTITSETPEAMRQLRQMHSELIQALERQGITSQNMSFQHQQHTAQQFPAPPSPFTATAGPANAAAGLAASTLPTTNHPSTPRSLPGGRLDIRL